MRGLHASTLYRQEITNSQGTPKHNRAPPANTPGRPGGEYEEGPHHFSDRARGIGRSHHLGTSRVGALVQAAVFDALNGIDRRYTPIHVPPSGPAGASRRAAAVQAAYVMLGKHYGTGGLFTTTQQGILNARRDVALVLVTEDDGSAAVASGVAWGQQVADASWAPLFSTPAHPEYPSGHSCVSGAAAEVLAHEFGAKIPIAVSSDQMIGVTRKFHGFSEAREDVKNARIFAGIHFRTAGGAQPAQPASAPCSNCGRCRACRAFFRSTHSSTSSGRYHPDTRYRHSAPLRVRPRGL